MKISFMQCSNTCMYRSCVAKYLENRAERKQRERTHTMEDLGLCLTFGTIAGLATAGAMYRNKSSKILLNSLEIAALVSGLSYILSLGADKFYKK